MITADHYPCSTKNEVAKERSPIYTAVLPTEYWRFEYIVSRFLIRHAQKIEIYVYTSLSLLKQRRKQGPTFYLFLPLFQKCKVHFAISLRVEIFWGEKAIDPLGGYEISGICSFYYVKNH